ncbi:MAG: TIGR02099 family protein, partial [Proteobacteria bacterium]|nr:TIGR02099 family protein [Pseudomonadota bacterium]
GLRHGRLTILEGELHYREQSRGIDDWLLRLPEVTIASDGRTHEFEGSFVPPGAIGEEVHFEFAAEGAPATPEDWMWKLDLAVRALKLDWWYQQFEWAGPGHLNGSLDMAFLASGKGIAGMVGKGDLALVDAGFSSRIPAMSAGPEPRFERIAMGWEFDYGNDRFAVDVHELAVFAEDQQLRDGSFSLRTGGEQYPLELAAARIPLDVLARFTQFLPRGDTTNTSPGFLAEVRSEAARLSPSGDLRELILALDLDATPARFRIETRFDRLGIAATEKLPGFRNLSGTLRADEKGGQLRIDSRDVRVDTSELFRQPLPVRAVSGRFSWEKLADTWNIQGRDLHIDNPEASVAAQLELAIPPDGSPVIDLTATAHNADFSARSTWLPVGVMPETLVDWLDSAILAGHSPEAKLVLHGPLENYPFRDGSGVFDVRFRAEDVIVQVDPDWPRVENLSADVHFHGPSLDIRVDRVDVFPGLDVAASHVRYADSRNPLLEVDSAVSGDTSAAWRFLAATPLAKPLSGLLESIEVSGPMRADVVLEIPLKSGDATAATINAELDGVRVQPVVLPWAVEGLSGALTVTEHDIVAPELTGRFTDAPFTAAIEAEPAADSAIFAPTRITLQGNSPTSAFEEYVPSSWLERLSGKFDWAGDLLVPADGSGISLRVASDFGGVQSELPVPLDTLPAGNTEISFPGESRIDIHVNAPALGAGRLRFVDTPGGWSFDRGQIVLGDSPDVALGDESGLLIEGRVGKLDAAGWLSLDGETDGAGEGRTGFLRGLDIQAGVLELGALSLASQSVRARRAGAGWDLGLAGPATGNIQVPSLSETRQPWQVRLEQLHLPGDAGNDGDAVTETSDDLEKNGPDPRKLPALDVNIRDLSLGSSNLGHVRGVLQRTSIGYTTQGMIANTPSYSVSLDGRWELIDDEHYTSVSAVLITRDLGDTLQALGYRGGIDADEGHVEINLAWHSSPMNAQRSLLEGNAGFRFSDGSLSEVSPGAGRLLGLLSIAALPRRLMLDFSDFFGKGLHFDTLSGDFLITGGSAYTTNVILEGPSTSALLVGRTGLVSRDYDQLAIIDPDVSASIPVAGYLAAGPTVGAALLLLSQLLKAPLADMAQVKYRITGSWDDPVIERVQQENNASK